jgi:hypothetical protein
MRDFSTTAVKCIQCVVDVNFYISWVVMVMGSAFSLTDHYSIFEFNVDIYGELANNLRSIMAYLAVTEIFILFYCCMTKQFQHFILVGFFLLMIIGSLEFYTQINNIETDPNIDIWLLYAGVSHILYGAKAVYKNQRALESHSK